MTFGNDEIEKVFFIALTVLRASDPTPKRNLVDAQLQ